MSTFAKPENALKRAEELVNVGQKQAALQALHDLITSKRHRAWQKPLERIMFKYVELCVDMRKGRFAKDGLIQYRIVCQQVNVNSLEEVIKYFLKLSTERAEQAQAAAAEVVLDVDDLEAEKRPEDLMLSYVSAEKGKERNDRELVTPWFKFLWETYRTCLEILRNNSKLESLYAMTAHKAFQFCLQYKRTTEFRRLCEILRNHLTNLNKYRDQRDRPELSLPETLQLYTETRFEQLKVATELELWQEAFRSVEDIHGLMSLVKKVPKPQLMAAYYAKLTKIFQVAGSHLYHAYTWYKLYNLQRNYNKNLTAKDQQLMASAVVLATLAIEPFDRKFGAGHFENELEKEKSQRMGSLLTFSFDLKKEAVPALSRSALLSEIVSKGLLAYVPQEVKDLYSLLETEFHPLDLATRLEPLLAKLADIGDSLSPASPVPEVRPQEYVAALQKVTTAKLLAQLSSVYQTVRITHLCKLIPFGDFGYIEKVAVDAIKYGFLPAKIDHKMGTVRFGIQDLESDRIKNHLVILARRLNKAVSLIHPEAADDKGKGKARSVAELSERILKEHKLALVRKVIIERRKEDAERSALEQERLEEEKRLQKEALAHEAERKRQAQDAHRRQEERIKAEIAEKEEAEAQALLAAQAAKKGGKKNLEKVLKKEGGKLNKRQLMEEALTESIRERQELERKLSKLSKTMDYFERAKRERERPLLLEAFKQRQQDDEVYYNQQQEELARESQEQHAKDLKEKHRLTRMLGDKSTFEEQVVDRRRGEFERLKREREERLAEARELRKQERAQRRKMEYYRRQEEERVRKEREEEEARKREEDEKKRAEEEERLRKLDEIAARQREREAETQRRAQEERERLLKEEREKPAKFVPPSLRGKATAEPAARAAPSEDRWERPRPAAGDRDTAPAAPAAAAVSEDKWRPRGAREPVSSREPLPARSDDRPAPAPGKFVPAHLRRPGADSAAAAPPPARPADGERPSGGYVPPSRRAAGSSAYPSRDREEPRGGSRSRW
ncbi:eukaryotic translation initiation factor eIF-3 subunit A [Klebsormidium nitens]|uniref:Eukaryotic translation initiation factor 3 subunit A n=1 Tax=Klebsormidium nitens TaxID=105231 RepID=A0A1Y1HXU8_KLENI|nr:eukaryotic translation initiation factor eIF-3 subunit A [Klebsormidium nitens]|eukprot:GAQ81367.1 eukaryotic translation initiation factor eIF-3 subunit A [Klebsormidium nitens]